MAVYTVVIDTGVASQDEVLAQLEALPAVVVVRFMGPGSLVEEEAIDYGDAPDGGE